MPVVAMFWRGDRGPKGLDVHLIASGAPPPSLRQFIVYLNDDGTAHPQFELGLPPEFISLTFSAVGTLAGVTVGQDDGQVTVSNSPNVPNNFLVRAIARRPTPIIVPGPVSVLLRFHVHPSITSVFFTPPRLTVHNDGPVAFSVLAKFGDGTVGNITNSGLTLALNAPPASQLSLDASTGKISTAATSPITSAGTITATLPATLGGGVSSGTGTIDVGTPLSASREVRLLTGGPGYGKRTTVDNFLLIGDGFGSTAADQKVFQSTAQRLVEEIRGNSTFYPLGKFIGNGNFFTLFLEGREAGSSVLEELTVLDRKVASGTVQAGVSVPSPTDPGDGRPISSVSDMIFRVGLPVSGDPTTLAAAIPVWESRYGQGVANGVTATRFQAWSIMRTRTLIEEADTALGVAFGNPPSAGRQPTDNVPQFHPLRLDRSAIDTLLGSVFFKPRSGATDNAIGRLWLTGRDPADPLLGRDREHVFVLTRAAIGGGLNVKSSISDVKTLFMAMSSNKEAALKVAPSGLFGVDVDRAPLKTVVSPASVIVHELGHSHSLGDERGGSAVTLPDTEVTKVPAFFNLQVARDLLTHPLPNGTNGLNGAAIRWGGYRRMRVAGALKDAPTALGSDRFTINLVRGHGKGFFELLPKPGEPALNLRLRRRPLYTLQGTTLVLSQPSAQSLALQSVKRDTLTVTAPGLDPSAWPGGSTLIYAPTVRAGVELTLLEQKIADHITATNAPLNRTPGTDCGPQLKQGVANNMPGDVLNVDTVGLFDGGSYFDCGLFHPTGSCMMFSSLADPTAITIDPATGVSVAPGTQDSVAPFCHVCAYVIVDLRDPSQHKLLDQVFPEFP